MASFLDSIGYNGWVLPALLVIPLVGAIVVLLLPAREPADGTAGVESPAARQVAFWFFVLEFIVSLGLWWSYNPADRGWQASIDISWIPSWGVRFTLGIDGIALMMVLLTTFIMPLSTLGSWTNIRTKVRSYYALLLILSSGMIGVFLARDLFLFYVMWEVMLVPTYFISGIWGGERRIYASTKFFLYTCLPALLKMGTFGFLRFGLPLFPGAALNPTVRMIILVLAVIGIIYGALVAMVQPDFKKLVAYSSVSHLGFVMLGIFALTLQSVQGALMVMINHGIST